ncbi:MAG: hypothetical protein V3R39_00015, partial [Nitrosopumilus sp.]
MHLIECKIPESDNTNAATLWFVGVQTNYLLVNSFGPINLVLVPEIEGKFYIILYKIISLNW